MLEDSFGVSLAGQERNAYISEQGRITALRQYSHWVSKVTIEEEEVGDDRDTIEALMGLLSSDEQISKTFFEEVGKYIDDSVLSLIAIPKHKCPACGHEQSSDEKAHPYLIPLDVSKVFFTLLTHRISKALQRSPM
jgi:hypothetical protein